MSASKDTILNSIRRNRPAAVELPELERAWTTYTDRRRQFIDVLEFVGGRAIVAPSRVVLDAELRQLPILSGGGKVVSLVPGVGSPNVDASNVESPHALADVDVAIMPAEFAVAENAAVWVTDRNLRHRVLYFLCQHLVLVVPAAEIVDHMHAAYERLGVAGDRRGSIFSEPMFGVFISGPSKTADIEQSLVIGAHGPRSLTVCLLDES
jgi:L-lactate dehydrogenase complex protein LldG